MKTDNLLSSLKPIWIVNNYLQFIPIKSVDKFSNESQLQYEPINTNLNQQLKTIFPDKRN